MTWNWVKAFNGEQVTLNDGKLKIQWIVEKDAEKEANSWSDSYGILMIKTNLNKQMWERVKE